MSLPIMDMSLDSACGEHSRALTMQRLNTDECLSGAIIRMVVDFVLIVAKAIMDCMNCIVDYRQGAIIGRIKKIKEIIKMIKSQTIILLLLQCVLIATGVWLTYHSDPVVVGLGWLVVLVNLILSAFPEP